MEFKIRQSYSSQITLLLKKDGQEISLSMISEDHIVLAQPQDLDKGDAQILMTVDGNPHVWDVHLPHGAVFFDEEVAIVDR